MAETESDFENYDPQSKTIPYYLQIEKDIPENVIEIKPVGPYVNFFTDKSLKFHRKNYKSSNLTILS